MSASAVFTIWVAASQLAAPSTGAMAQALGETLGPEVRVRTETFPEDRPELARTPRADESSAVLSWDSPRHLHARLRLCRPTNECVERWVTFEDADPELERGRTLGFLAAGVFLDTQAKARAPARAEPAQPPAPAAPPRPPFPRGELNAAAVVAGPNDGTSLGATLGAEYAWTEQFRLGAAGEIRFGEVEYAQASSRIVSGMLKATITLLRPARRLWLGVSAGAGVYQLSLSHFSADDAAPRRQSRLLPGGAAAGVVALDVGASSALYAEVGVEVLGGKTEVYVHHIERAEWPLLSPVLRLGLLAGF